MLRSITIEGFKCFQNSLFQLAPLTLLSGMNASGKTSLLQALAVLHQTACQRGNFDQLILNGPVVRLGRAADVLHKTKARDSVRLTLESAQGKWEHEYAAERRSDFTFTLTSSRSTAPGKDKDLLRLCRSWIYLCADRLGPREMHSLDDSAPHPDVGVRGEYAVSRLLALEDFHVRPALCKRHTPPLLPKQVEAHMQALFPGFQLELQSVQGTNVATLGLATDQSVGFVRPQNIGFGLSYTLPIYVACLSAQKDTLILLENPEAHLHPYAQSQMGLFLADVASAGVQLIVETHSDHLLNGIRRAVKSREHGLCAEQTALFFFHGVHDGTLHVSNPFLTADGRLSEWPEGFFDQYDKDLAELVDW